MTAALFVPGHRPDRFAKAAQAGCDLVIVDLEDAVPPDRKTAALDAALVALGDPRSGFAAAMRINPLERGGREEARALGERLTRIRAVMLPKAEEPGELEELADLLPVGTALIPLVETARGIRAAGELATAAGVSQLAFGAYDFAADVGSPSPTILDHARCELVLASRCAGIRAPWDSPTAEFRDRVLVREAAVHARSLGFGGKLCIHPDQVPLVNDAFAPTAEEVAWARSVVAAAIDGAGQVDGAMVDRPIALRAESILERAGVGAPTR